MPQIDGSYTLLSLPGPHLVAKMAATLSLGHPLDLSLLFSSLFPRVHARGLKLKTVTDFGQIPVHQKAKIDDGYTLLANMGPNIAEIDDSYTLLSLPRSHLMTRSG